MSGLYEQRKAVRLRRASSKTASERLPFLLVRFLWANKENEQIIATE
jgi:hypothetical protein